MVNKKLSKESKIDNSNGNESKDDAELQKKIDEIKKTNENKLQFLSSIYTQVPKTEKSNKPIDKNLKTPNDKNNISDQPKNESKNDQIEFQKASNKDKMDFLSAIYLENLKKYTPTEQNQVVPPKSDNKDQEEFSKRQLQDEKMREDREKFVQYLENEIISKNASKKKI